jgi:hypothetical protein
LDEHLVSAQLASMLIGWQLERLLSLDLRLSSIDSRRHASTDKQSSSVPRPEPKASFLGLYASTDGYRLWTSASADKNHPWTQTSVESKCLRPSLLS